MTLQRNLPYPALTCAKQLVALVGSPRTLGQAVPVTGSRRRRTTEVTPVRRTTARHPRLFAQMSLLIG